MKSIKSDIVKGVFKNEPDKNVKIKGNLFPTNYKQFFWTILSSQVKWNKVFDKFIQRVDELEKTESSTVKAKEGAAH